MIVIGSYALALTGHRNFDKVNDIDLIGTRADVEQFRAKNHAIIDEAWQLHDHRYGFKLKAGQPVEKVEIDTEQAASDQMLPALCERTADILGLAAQLPPLEVLYLIKRAHANVPVHYDKTIRDLLQIKPLIGHFTPEQITFGQARKRECRERYALNRQRFSLAIKNEDFFDNSDHIRYYVHDDLHEVVAHEAGQPLYKRCKQDLNLAKIDTDLFEQLSQADQLKMAQEEFMVIGLERFYFHDRALHPAKVYRLGMHKTIRDLFVGYFQDFCIDHIDQLVTPPPFNFVERFVEAERANQLHQVVIKVGPITETHKKIWQLIRTGHINEARTQAEDLIRHAEYGHDSHAFFLLGASLFLAKNLPAAERCLRKCLSRDRENAMAFFYLGATLRAQGRHNEALSTLKQAEQHGFKLFGLYWNLGLAYEGLSKPDLAIAAYQHAQQLKPGDPRPTKRLAALSAIAPTGATP